MTGTIELNGEIGRFARGWHEVTPVQAKNLALVLLGSDAITMRELNELSRKGKGKDPERIEAANTAYMAVAMQLLPIVLDRNNGAKFLREYVQLQPQHYAAIIGVEDEKQNPVKWCFKGGLLKQLQPMVHLGGVAYYGPSDYLGGVTFFEYLAVQNRYKQWLDDRTKVRLARLFSALFRPERTDVPKGSADYLEDKREPFNGKLCELRTEKFMALPEAEMLVAVLWWQGCNAQLMRDFPLVFQGTSGNSVKPGETVLRLAGGSGKKAVEDQGNAPIKNVMMYLNDQAKAPKKR